MYNHYKLSKGLQPLNDPTPKKFYTSTSPPTKKRKVENPTTPKTIPKNIEYQPEYKSGGYSIIISMYKHSENPFETIFTKEEIQKNSTEL